MNDKKLKKILKDHKLWIKTGNKKGSRANLSNETLFKKDLSGVDLSYADLSYSILDSVDLSGANLCNATIVRARVYHTNFSFANLTGVNLKKTTLYDVDFYKANLSKSNLNNLDLLNVNLHNIKIDFPIIRMNSSKYNITVCNWDDVKIGCCNFSLDEWLFKGEEIAHLHNEGDHYEAEIKEIIIALDVIRKTRNG